MSSVAAEYNDKFLVFEFYPDDRLGNRFDQYDSIQHAAPCCYSSTFYFEGFQTEWWARKFQEKFDEFGSKWNNKLPVAALGNHDQTRIASKFGMAQAKALAVMQLTLPGIPAVYYGEELGMLDVDVSEDDVRDTFSGGAGFDARDKYRTPMRWDSSEYVGFSTTKPWLPIGEYRDWMNVASQQETKHSFLRLYQKLLRLRRQEPALRYGEYSTWRETSDEFLTFARRHNDTAFYTAMNFTDRQVQVDIPTGGRVVASTNTADEYDVGTQITLQPFEALVVRAHS